MQSAKPCSICSEGGHRESKCPELRAPLREGFQGGGGGGGGGHDHDDDETAAVKVETVAVPTAALQDQYDDPTHIHIYDEDDRLCNLLFRGGRDHGPDCYELRA